MPSISELLQTTPVKVAIAVVVVIILGGLSYYFIESAPPRVVYAAVTKGDITEDITATGMVTPVQNPTLTFESGGQVTSLDVKVGDKVSAGTLLASLDTSVLGAQLEAAEASLNQLESGPRSVDIAGQQTAVTSAQQTLTNTYTNYPQMLESTYAQAQQAVNTGADPLFNFSNPNNPSFMLSTTNQSDGITVDQDRYALISLFNTWQEQVAAVPAAPSPSQLETQTNESITNLEQIRTLFDDLVTALNDTPVSPTFTQSQESADLAQVNAGRDTINSLITSLTAAGQSITTQQLAVESAQDQLNQTLAGASTQSIEAQQAVVSGIEAQIKQQQVIAPFSGTIASVFVNTGDVVTATTPIISLIPSGNFEVEVYLPENDIPSLTVGDATDITLDAYGTGRIFPATVSAIDTSPTTQADGTQGYKVTLVFNTADPAITNGMHANATIHAGSADNVLLIPKSALITNGTENYVLKEAASGPVETPITVGISNSTSVEVLSGLSQGDQVSLVGSQ